MIGFWIAWMVLGVGGVAGVGRSGTDNGFDGWKLMIAFFATSGAFLIYGLWARIYRLTLNPQNRTYLWERGLYPFIQRRSGSLNEFQQVLCLQQRHSEQSGNYLVWRLIFSWKQPGRTSPYFFLDHSPAVKATTQLLAQRLDLPLYATPLKEPEKNIDFCFFVKDRDASK
jgi:hypothetical protein